MLFRDAEREILPTCLEAGIGVIAHSPLAKGILTGKYRRGQPPPPGTRGQRSQYVQKYLTEANFDILEKLEAFAAARGHTTGELAVAWLLAEPQVSCVISGATKPEQVEANAKAAEWKLTPEELAEARGILESAASR
jgi:aryl-alcohol dehydrogenase-like predicted oxidoreductase